jgi:hypothetical protein
MKILYSTPLPPSDSTINIGSPGALRKIGLTIKLLKEMGHAVVLLDTSHFSSFGKVIVKECTTQKKVGTEVVDVVTPHLTFNRKLGKLIQAASAPKIGINLVKKYGFDIVLIYNAYLFESRLVEALFAHSNIPYILQLEDLPWSRRRGYLNIKPILEKIFFQANMPAGCVNSCCQ